MEPNFSRDELVEAFGVLLGTPLDRFDPNATYAVYEETALHCDENGNLPFGVRVPGDLAADHHPTEVNEAITGLVTTEESYPGSPSFSLADSLFIVDRYDDEDRDEDDEDEESASPLFEAFESVAVPGADSDTVAVTGRALAALLPSLQTTFGAYAELGAAFRVVTDGTLFDAMMAATRTRPADRPRSYADACSALGCATPQAPPRASWATALERLPNADLRDHLYALAIEQDWGCDSSRSLRRNRIGLPGGLLSWFHAGQEGYDATTVCQIPPDRVPRVN